MAIKFVDNQAVSVTFKYGNCSRSPSKDGDGSFYYTFDGETDKFFANPYLARAVADNWPGRGGTVSITKLNTQAWTVQVLNQAQTIYPLEMRQWSDETNSFEKVEFEIYPDAKGAAQPTTAAAPQQQAAAQAPAATQAPQQAAPTAQASQPSVEAQVAHGGKVMRHCLAASYLAYRDLFSENPDIEQFCTPETMQSIASTLFINMPRHIRDTVPEEIAAQAPTDGDSPEQLAYEADGSEPPVGDGVQAYQQQPQEEPPAYDDSEIPF